ncbi:DUF448 domain-containing protein [Altererythrobacter sp. SALINAS58]|uniref:DUF448 domain-containing protein n=1 Tax=Alteripontixanthobacter muriae TaxID=2705546 RepID=UPI001576A12A|nr:DUF448 domain-containing protein [Alteripontixanthobacter muriae]NTZ41756.1 DUF448 domain-containing protein [Alteripontixanthobacter muriae]
MRNPRNESLVSDRSEGAQARETGPERRCILSGEILPRDNLLRLAISPEKPDGACDVLPDPLARAPGRGAWLGASRGELEQAMQKGRLRGALARAYKGAKLDVPDDLPDLIEQALTRNFSDRLGLAMRSGALILGSDRIAEQARAGRVAWLAHASDASADGNAKLDQAWRVGQDAEGSGAVGVRLPLDRAALSVALGRDNVVHLAIGDAKLAARIDQTLQRLLPYVGRPGPEPGTASLNDAAPGEMAREAADTAP